MKTEKTALFVLLAILALIAIRKRGVEVVTSTISYDIGATGAPMATDDYYNEFWGG